MDFAIVEGGTVVNIVVIELPDLGAFPDALPVYEGCTIGQPYDPPRIYTEIELTQQSVTDLELSDIEQGQNATDLELMIIGGQEMEKIRMGGGNLLITGIALLPLWEVCRHA